MPFYRDDDNVPLGDPAGLGPRTLAQNVTMTAAVQEISINTGAATQQGMRVLRLASMGQAAYYTVGPAGQGGTYTTANMMGLPGAWVEYLALRSTDVSLYVLQGGAAGVLSACVWG